MPICLLVKVVIEENQLTMNNVFEISSLSSKEVRFYLVKKGTKAHDHRSSAALWEIFELRKLLLLKAPPPQ